MPINVLSRTVITSTGWYSSCNRGKTVWFLCEVNWKFVSIYDWKIPRIRNYFCGVSNQVRKCMFVEYDKCKHVECANASFCPVSCFVCELNVE